MKWFAALGLGLALAGCGGGGGDPGDSRNYDALTAWNRFLTASPRSYVVTGVATTDGLSYELRLGAAPVGGSSFPLTGSPANRVDVTSSVRRLSPPAALLGSGVSEVYYDNTLRVLGSRDTVDADPATCTRATAASVPPAVARLGNSGALYTVDDLDGCGPGALRTGTTTTTWSVEGEAGIVFFCINSVSRNNAGAELSRESDCLEIDTAGTPGLRARVSVSVPGVFSLTARN